MVITDARIVYLYLIIDISIQTSHSIYLEQHFCSIMRPMQEVPAGLREAAETLVRSGVEHNNDNATSRPHDLTTDNDAPTTVPNCRNCNNPLSLGTDIQKKGGKFLTNCKSCRDIATAKRRRRKARHSQFSIPNGSRSSKKCKVASLPPKEPTPPPPDPECTICADTFPAKDLTSLSECAHEPDVCHECFLAWLAQQMESTAWDRITCPSTNCSKTLTHDDVKANASAGVFARYDIPGQKT
jgi:hypothetical protein